MPDAFSGLASAVAAATKALEHHSALPAHVESTAMLRELAVGIDRLNRLLEGAILGRADAAPALAPTAPSTKATAGLPPALPAGLTLKAVSRRTGIPAATLRTWEHRYGFLRPRRSPTGYRLYGEEEIARIEQVKYLLGQAVRIGAAMKAMTMEAGEQEVEGEGRQPDDQSSPRESGRNAEIYRIPVDLPVGVAPDLL